MWNPINRTQVQVEENKYRIYPKAGPINYKKSDGTFDEIDHTFNDTTSSIGDISLMNKGVVSVGKRKGNNPTKVVGIRPDKNQHLGTQQLEFSLVNVELDGESQSFDVETDLEIQLGPAQVFQLVKVNKDFNDFKVVFDIHNTGLELQNSKYSSTTTIREDFDFNLTNLGEIEGGNTSLTKDSIYNSSSGSILQKNTPYLDFYVSKITNDYIQTGEYSTEEEFGDSDLSSYTLESMYALGSSIYFKDSIVLNVKSYQIDNVQDIVINNLCYLYGLEVFDDGGNGKYFTKNNKKVGAYLTTLNSDEFYVMFNTKDIPDNIKTLFKKKTFNDTSYLDITLSDFSTTLTNQFNKNTTIELNTDYYEPINDEFVFKINNEAFQINLPILYDENHNILDLGTTHSLKQNSNGSYRYTKYFSLDGYLKNSHNIKYIDATIAVGTSQASRQREQYGPFTPTQRTTSNFSTTRDKVTASARYLMVADDFPLTVAGWVNTAAFSNSGTTKAYQIYNTTIAVFDTSGVTSTVNNASFKMRAYNLSVGSNIPSDIHLINLKCDSELGNSVTNFNDYAGFTSGWDASDVTEYSGETEFEAISGDNATLDLVGNSDFKSDIENNDEVQCTAVEYEEWYLNSFDGGMGAGPDNTASCQRNLIAYSFIASTAALRPYLEYSTDAASGYTHKVAGVAAASISKVKSVATANIGKVNSVD